MGHRPSFQEEGKKITGEKKIKITDLKRTFGSLKEMILFLFSPVKRGWGLLLETQKVQEE